MRKSFVHNVQASRGFLADGFYGTAGRDAQGCEGTDAVAGDKPSALAVSLISPGSLVD